MSRYWSVRGRGEEELVKHILFGTIVDFLNCTRVIIGQKKLSLNEKNCSPRSCFQKLHFGASTSTPSRSYFGTLWASRKKNSTSLKHSVWPNFSFSI